jgi:hypothetical protein
MSAESFGWETIARLGGFPVVQFVASLAAKLGAKLQILATFAKRKFMRMRAINCCLLFLMFAVLTACQDQQPAGDSEKSLEEIKQEGPISNADMIRNPVSAEEIDTVNVAKINFEEVTYDFGTIPEGKVIEHTFKFTNTGKAPLIISNARSTCGCTIPKWPKKPIPPGEEGEIRVRFDSKGKKNAQNKPVTITANTYPNTTRVFLKGNVEPVVNEPSK